jgi:Na+/H+ antiporter NhaD/arsenite permease-like protein
MLTIGSVTVNVLPILMTLINIVSGMIYTRGMPLKSKIQLYGMALIFLVLLYDSPAGLVFYWTLNNLFSLGKNILSKLKRPSAKATENPGTTGACACATGIVRHQKAIFFTACALLTILTGLLIPSALIADSPAEFVEMNAFRSPLIYVVHSFLLAAGTFLICVILTQVMDNTALINIFTPVVVAAAMKHGMSALPVILAVDASCLVSFSTTLASPSSLLAYQLGGYSMKEMLKFNLPCILIATVFSIFWIPFYFGAL